LEIASPEILAQRDFVDFLFLGPLPTKDQDKTQGTSWRRLYKPGDKGGVDFSKRAGSGEKAGIHYYAVATITSPTNRDARLHFDHYDDMSAWLNGEEVYRVNKSAYTRARTVKLRKGRNVVIIRLANRKGRHAFKFARSNLRHEPLADVKIECPQP
jgi:hypothetical protein